MKRRLVLIALMASGLGCATGNSIPSLVQVIDDPRSFSGQDVRLYGYLGGLGLHLFLTADHERIGDHSSAIAVQNLSFHESAISEYCRGYAIVEGRVLKNDDVPILHLNQVGLYHVGELRRILVFPEDGPLHECWPDARSGSARQE